MYGTEGHFSNGFLVKSELKKCEKNEGLLWCFESSSDFLPRHANQGIAGLLTKMVVFQQGVWVVLVVKIGIV